MGPALALYQRLIDAHEGHTIDRFAQRGFFEDPEAAAERTALGAQAVADGCDPVAGLISVLDRGQDLHEQGPGQALAKGLLLARASELIRASSGGKQQEDALSSLVLPPAPANGLTMEDAQAIDPEGLDTCPEIASAILTLQQVTLNEAARVDPQTLLVRGIPSQPELKTIAQSVLDRGARIGCGPPEIHRLVLEGMDVLEARGFAANLFKGSLVEEAWAILEPKLVTIEITLSLSVRPKTLRPGTVVTYVYEVKNVGTVPLGGVQVVDQTRGAVQIQPTLIEPGQSAVGTLSEELSGSAPAERVNVSAQVSAADPFGVQVLASDTLEVPVLPT